MARRAAAATGNFTTAGTWGAIDATSYSDAETGATAVTTSYVASSSFTPGVITIDGIGLKIATRSGVTGTMSVHLAVATVEVTGTLVTINVADLPGATTTAADGGWIFFKFAAPVLLVAATAYTVEVKTSSGAQVNLFRDGTVANWSRYLRTTTTGAPAAGDDLIIGKEYTGAGTGNTLTVTMDNTAATDFGSAPTAANGLLTPGISVCNGGSLVWGVAAATNYYLRMSNSIIVYNGGTYTQGGAGTEIPRDSTAKLFLDPAADGDYGLLFRGASSTVGGTGNINGLSRTSGKNVVSCKMTVDAPSSANLLTGGITTNHGLTSGANTTLATSTILDPSGTSLLANAITDSAVNSFHAQASSGTGNVTNTTQVVSIWLARGVGTNNRYVRLQYGNTGLAALTNGFRADIDMLAGTIGSCTAVGNGTATSSAIVAVGTGFLCTIIGKASSGALSPIIGVQACNAAGVASYAGDTTQNFLYYGPKVFTASALPTDTLTVDADTGWLSGDVIAVASTSRTAADCELLKLNSGATATTLPCSMPLNGGGTVHSGTSPTQAEVILITRNVVIASFTPTLMTYVFCDQTSVVTINWAEFYYLGVAASNKRGIEVGTTTGSFSMQFSSIHDTEVVGLNLVGGGWNNVTFSSNIMWNLSVTTGPGVQTVATTGTNWTIDSNVLIRTGNSGGWLVADVGGTFTNNTAVGALTTGFTITNGAVIGTISGLTAHSNTSAGIAISSASGLTGTIGASAIWRNLNLGLSIVVSPQDLVLDSFTMFGNGSSNITIAVGSTIQLKSPVLNGDTTYPTTSGINLNAIGNFEIVINNGDFSTVGGIKTAHTNDINLSSDCTLRATLRNTKLGATIEVATPENLFNSGFVSSEKHDQTAGNHKTWTRYGLIATDSVIFNTAAPSQRCTPTNAVSKLESAPQFQGMKVAVANGASVTIGSYVRKSLAGDAGGFAYAGNQPRLIQKANPALGQDSDVVIATMTVANGNWELLTGTSSVATDDGAWEFVVDCDGTSGAWINVDDWSAS